MNQYSIKPNISRILLPQLFELIPGIILLYLLVINLIRMGQEPSLIVHILVLAILVTAALLQLFVSYLNSAKTAYTIMADRIEITGKMQQTIMLAQVQQVNIRIGLFDRLFGTGTIILDGFKIRNINNPQQVLQYIQQMVNSARYYRTAQYTK